MDGQNGVSIDELLFTELYIERCSVVLWFWLVPHVPAYANASIYCTDCAHCKYK